MHSAFTLCVYIKNTTWPVISASKIVWCLCVYVCESVKVLNRNDNSSTPHLIHTSRFNSPHSKVVMREEIGLLLAMLTPLLRSIRYHDQSVIRAHSCSQKKPTVLITSKWLIISHTMWLNNHCFSREPKYPLISTP